MNKLRLQSEKMQMTQFYIAAAIVLAGFAVEAQEYELGGAKRPNPSLAFKVEGQYKRVHQTVLRYLLRDRDSEARAFLDQFLEENADDAESYFLLGLLEVKAGDVQAAAKSFSIAIEKGLPKERLIAGPRDLIKSALTQPVIRDVFTEFSQLPVHGPLVGRTSDSSASFWIRTTGESNVTVIVSKSNELTEPVESKSVRSDQDRDFTAIAVVNGLAPDTEYFYGIQIDGGAILKGDQLRFRTFPKRGSGAKFRIAFGGGAGFVPPHERMWDTILAEGPLALLLLGDNVYIDDPESPEMQRYTYYRRQSRPEWRKLTGQTSVYTIWDDHDFSTNDSWGGPSIEIPFWKRDYAFKIYRENWANPGYAGGDQQPGCWYSFSIGDVDFIMLDCRYYRTDPNGETLSMLGPAQLEWLKGQLRQADGTFKVLCSSVPWDFRTKGGSKDTWNGYRDEREEIFGFLASNKIDGVVLMSADRHRSDAWRIDRTDGYRFYEFNSSRLTNQHVHPTMEKQGALFSYNKKQSFGLVTFDTTLEDPAVTYEVLSIDGERIDSLTVKASQLRHN